jgi:hypothetical protein
MRLRRGFGTRHGCNLHLAPSDPSRYTVAMKSSSPITEALRQPYTPPTLDDHGSIVEMTQQVRPAGGPSELVSHFEDLESSNA